MKKILYEVTRSQMNANNKKGKPYVDYNQHLGKNRYERRVHSKLGTSVNQLNRLDMNKLFKEDILDINLEVKGETDDYIVRISFSGFLDELHDQLKQNNNELDLKAITRALVRAFNSENVFISCTCPDFRYRFAHWATVGDFKAGEGEIRPNRFDVTNKDNVMGSSCKHIALALANTSWLIRTGNVIRNYIGYMEKHYEQLYADVIYPAIYEKPYEGDNIQQDLFGVSELDDNNPNNVSPLTANKWARTKGQWQKGNEYRFRKLNDENPDQQEFDLDSLADEENVEEEP